MACSNFILLSLILYRQRRFKGLSIVTFVNQVAKAFTTKILAHCGRSISFRKVAEEFKQAGLTVARSTLSEYVTYLKEALLVYEVHPRTRSTAHGNNACHRFYPADPGLARANMPAAALDQGQILEEAVAIELLRRQGAARSGTLSTYLTKERHYEVDFCVGDALWSEKPQLYQVAWDISSPSVCDRESRALWVAMEETEAETSIIIFAQGEEQTLTKRNKTIHCIPAYKWLLKDSFPISLS